MEGDLKRHFTKQYIKITNTNMERCVTSLIPVGMQVKTTTAHH